MQKKLTISIGEDVYEGLHNVIGPRKISKFIEELARPHVIGLKWRKMKKEKRKQWSGPRK